MLDEYNHKPGEIGRYTVFEIDFNLSTQVITHQRSYYNLLNLIGDLGGVLEIFIVIFGIIFFKLSAFSLKLKFFEKLFLAFTTSNEIFNISRYQKKNSLKAKFKMLKVKSSNLASI